MRGLKNENIHYLKNRFHIRHINVTGDPLMPDHHITLEEGLRSEKPCAVTERSGVENKKGIHVFT